MSFGARVKCAFCPIVGICSVGNERVSDRYWDTVSIRRGDGWIAVNAPVFNESPLNSLFNDGVERTSFIKDWEAVSLITSKCPLRPQNIPDLQAQVYRLTGEVELATRLIRDIKLDLQIHMMDSIWNRIKRKFRELRS